MKQPVLIIIGGANGSGKTTFALEITAEKKIERNFIFIKIRKIR